MALLFVSVITLAMLTSTRWEVMVATNGSDDCRWLTVDDDDDDDDRGVALPDCAEGHNFTLKAKDANRSDCQHPLSPQLLNCPLLRHNASDYTIKDDDHSFVDLETGFEALPGDFYVDAATSIAYTCRSVMKKRDTPRCHYLSVSPGDYEICDGGVHVFSANVTVRRPSSWTTTTTDENGSLDLCVPITMRLLACLHWNIMEPDFEILPDGRLHDVPNDKRFAIGDYYGYDFDGDYGFKVCAYEPEDTDSYFVYYIIAALQTVSVVFLAVSIVLHLILIKRNCQTKSLLCFKISMTAYYVGLAGWTMIAYEIIDSKLCYVIFAVTYFSSISAFIWLAVVSFDACRFFTGRLYRCPFPSHRFTCYSVVAWGTPLTLLTVALLVDRLKRLQHALNLYPRIQQACWFNERPSRWVFYYAPLSIVLTCNLIFFTITVVALLRLSRGIEMANRNMNRQLLRVYLRMFIITGVVVKLAEIVVWNVEENEYWYVSKFIGSVQGIAVSVACIWRRSTLRLVRTKLCNGRCLRPASLRPHVSVSTIASLVKKPSA